jgi:hypothetical protein
MLPPKSHPRLRQLVTGEYSYSFQVFAGSMCVSRNLREVQKSSGSPEAVAAAIDDVYAFFTKFESVLAADLKAIFG